MSKFKVGDRVLATDNLFIHKTPSPGTIVEIYESYVYPYAVEYDDRPGSRWWSTVHDEIKRPAKQPVIVITSDGKTTTATKRLGKKVICTATARCSDNDTFDFNTGAELAFQRLREKEWPVPKEDPIPEKLVCIWTCVPDFTKGKVYKTLRAPNRLPKVRDNDNYTWILSEEKVGGYYIDSFFEHQAQFIPLVED